MQHVGLAIATVATVILFVCAPVCDVHIAGHISAGMLFATHVRRERKNANDTVALSLCSRSEITAPHAA